MTPIKELIIDIKKFFQEFESNPDKFNEHVIQYDILLNNMKDMQYYQKFLSLNNELENLETNIKNLTSL